MAAPDKKQMWIDWTHDALAGYEQADDVEDIDGVVDDMSELASRYADAMLEEYEERFNEGAPRRRRKKKEDD